MAVDGAGNIYIGDGGNYRIRRVSRDGIIDTYAGDGVQRSQGDNGPPLRASFDKVFGLAVDAAGNLYVSDNAAHRIRRIAANGGTICSTPTGTTPIRKRRPTSKSCGRCGPRSAAWTRSLIP